MRKMFFILLILFWGCTESNKYGTITENSVTYTENGYESYFPVKKSERVLYRGTCKSKTVYDEPITKIMLPNKAGDFVNGFVVCIPERKIKWD